METHATQPGDRRLGGSCPLRTVLTRLSLRFIVKKDHYLRFESSDGESTFPVDLVGPIPQAEQVTV
jgi:hypothetical protein